MKRLLLLPAFVVGCATGGGSATAEPARSAIEVVLPGTASQAFEKTKAAFVDESLSLAQADAAGGLIVSTPTTPNPGGMVRGQYQYRATLLPRGDSTRVVLTGTMGNLDAGAMSQAISGVRVESAAKPLTSACRVGSECGRAWTRLERIAATLRK